MNAILGGPGKIFAPSPFNSGSSFSHWDETTFAPGDQNSLMTPFLGFQEANHDPGPITLGMFNDHGWTLSQDCEGPDVVDLSENCDITGISFNPNFGPGIICDNPGVFSPDGGAFGPVGSHVACFRVEGIDPFNQPLDDSNYEVKIKGKVYPILARGYDFFAGEQYFFICVGGIPSDGKKNLQVKIKLAPGCTFTEPSMFDAPDCSIDGGAIASLVSPSSVTESTTIPDAILFPNPSTGIFNLNVDLEIIPEITIINNVGQVVKRLIGTSGSTQIDLSDQLPGLYFVNINSKSIQEVHRIILTR